MPPVTIVDMREELKNGNRSMFSRSLYKAIEDRLHKKEQICFAAESAGLCDFRDVSYVRFRFAVSALRHFTDVSSKLAHAALSLLRLCGA